MAAPKGNSYWRQRLEHGRKHKIKTADELKEGALDYLQYLHENPFMEIKAGFSGGEANYAEVPKMRAPTLQGLWVHLCLTKGAWYLMKNERGEDFREVCEWIEKTFYDWKFQGAASGFLNHAIIARDLGLRERTDITSGDEPIKAVVVSYD